MEFFLFFQKQLKFNFIFSSQIEKLAHDIKTLSGPIYDVESSHKFNEIEKKIQDLKSLQGPVYPGVEREHHYFAVLEQSWAHLKDLANPLYDIEREHSFVDLGKKVESLRGMNYPVREGVDYSHHFNQVQQRVVNLKNLTGNITFFKL